MTHPIDGTQQPGGQTAGPEKPPWPGDPTKDTLPPLTAPLVEEYVTRIRLMEKALELTRWTCSTDKGASRAFGHFKGAYDRILRSLLEEAGLERPEGTDGKDQEGS